MRRATSDGTKGINSDLRCRASQTPLQKAPARRQENDFF